VQRDREDLQNEATRTEYDDMPFPDDDYMDWLKPGGAPPRAGQSLTAPATVAPPAPTPLGRVGLTPGWTPDYKALIRSNPAYLSWQNNATMDVQQAAAARRATLQALAVRYGGIGGGFKDAYGDIDPNTLELAKGNQYSDTARLSRNYEQSLEAIRKGLAARGGLQSGELPYGLQQADYARASGEYDLGQEFANAVQSAINSYLGSESGARSGEYQALSEAEQNVYANPLNRPTEGTEASLDPDWQSKYGTPVYVGPDGQLYVLDSSGNPQVYSPRLSSPESGFYESDNAMARQAALSGQGYF
jgi:hypothetical protein